MSVEIKKGTIKIIVISSVTVIVAVALIVGIIFGIKIKRKNDMKEKINQINAQELQEELIKELEKSPININNPSVKTRFKVAVEDPNVEISDDKIIVGDNADLLNSGMSISYSFTEDPPRYVGYITAFITYEPNTKSSLKGVAIPCFKIESNSNGKFKNIIFAYKDDFGIADTVYNILKNLLKEKYDVDITVLEYDDYIVDSRGIYYTDKEFAVDIIKTISDKISISNKSKSDIRAMLKDDGLHTRDIVIEMTKLNNY